MSELTDDNSADSKFRSALHKIQEGIETLQEITTSDFVPVSIQVMGVEVAAEDINEILKKLLAQRAAGRKGL